MPTATTSVLVDTQSVTLADSYRHCRRVAKERAKNFYYSFLLLEDQQRDSMCAIYAFMRRCDDLSDDEATENKDQVRSALASWRMELEHALEGDTEGHPIWPAFADTVKRYNIPHRFFHEMIDGVASDVDVHIVQTWSELYDYCYHVASVVGMTIIYIWGFSSPKALLLAEKCGIAFQVTNILRDVREDAELGRLYLPLTDLQQFGVSREQLQSGTETEAFRELMRFEAKRAHAYYNESEPLLGLISKRSRRSLWAIREIYTGLLDRLEAANFGVLSHRINVPKRVKIGILFRAFFKAL